MERVEEGRPTPGPPLLDVQNLVVHFPISTRSGFQQTHQVVRAVEDVSFSIKRGETLGLVGESGCGKSTTSRAILRLHAITAGRIFFDGIDLGGLSGEAMRRQRRHVQMVFQDPYSSLNPRKTVGQIVGEPLIIHRIGKSRQERRERVQQLLTAVGLPPEASRRYPHEFSGGQRQRIGIARALAVDPMLLILDEPVSALDVSVRAQIVNLLKDLQTQFGLTYLFISHDLSIVRHMSDRVAVMYLGKLVEVAGRDEIATRPLHPYTQALLSAVPVPDPQVEKSRKRIVLSGDAPNPIRPPSGCRFHPRCPWARLDCAQSEPTLQEVMPGRFVACHYWDVLADKPGSPLLAKV